MPSRALAVFAASSLLGLMVGACYKPAEHDPRTDPPLVMLAKVQPAGPGRRDFTGIVTARVQSDLGFRVAGKVTARLVDVGQRVHRGDLLMRLDPNDLSLLVNARAADLAAAHARLVQASAEEARELTLAQAHAVSPQTYDLAKATAEDAKAQLAAAEAQLQGARNSGDYTRLAADVDGTVVGTMAEPGQVVGAGQVVVRLAAAGPREAAVNLPETWRPALDSRAEAILYAGKEERSAARLRQLSEAADEQTRTFEARYVLEGAGANVPLGSTVTIRVPGDPADDATTVPLGAIADVGDGPGVWIPDAQTSTVSFRPVRVARLTEEDAIVVGGLRVGETVVALGANRLHEGEGVQLGLPGDIH